MDQFICWLLGFCWKPGILRKFERRTNFYSVRIDQFSWWARTNLKFECQTRGQICIFRDGGKCNFPPHLSSTKVRWTRDGEPPPLPPSQRALGHNVSPPRLPVHDWAWNCSILRVRAWEKSIRTFWSVIICKKLKSCSTNEVIATGIVFIVLYLQTLA